MRWDKSRMNLHSWTKWERTDFCVCCLLTVLWAFVPASPQMSVNVSHGICCRTEQICMRAFCFDRLSVLPSPFPQWKYRDMSLFLFLLKILLFLIFYWRWRLRSSCGLMKALTKSNWIRFSKPEAVFYHIVLWVDQIKTLLCFVCVTNLLNC